MEFDIQGNPDFGDLTIRLNPGETVLCESGAMSRMSEGMQVQSKLMGGFGKALIRKLTGGESLFVGEYSHPDGGFVSLSPSIPGSVLHRKMEGDALYMEPGAFLAATPEVEVDTKFLGFKAFLSGEGPFFLHVHGTGDLFYNAYAGVMEKEIDGELVIDTGHVVAWEPSLEWSLSGMGNLKSTLLSGEGLVLRFNGKGKVWVQTRAMGGFIGWISGYCLGRGRGR